MKAKRKEDLKELKILLRLDADTPIHPSLLQDDDDGVGRQKTPGDDQMDVSDGSLAKKRKKPTTKQRKANQLRRSNPQREQNPMQLADYQV